MAKKSPLFVVKERYGSKEKLIDTLAPMLESLADESNEDHKRRLRRVSNAKLLHLVDRAERVKSIGGRDGLVQKLLEMSGQSRDHEYGDALKRRSLGRLVDDHARQAKLAKRSRA